MSIFNKLHRPWPHVAHHAGPCFSTATIKKVLFWRPVADNAPFWQCSPRPCSLPRVARASVCVCRCTFLSFIFICLNSVGRNWIQRFWLLQLRFAALLSHSWAFLTRSWDAAATWLWVELGKKRETLDLRKGLHSAHPLDCTPKIPGWHFWEAPTLIQATSFVANY